MVVSIGGQRMYMWRAVDSEGEVLDVLVQTKRNKAAALKLMRRLLKKYGVLPESLVTDDLRSYHAAARDLLGHDGVAHHQAGEEERGGAPAEQRKQADRLPRGLEGEHHRGEQGPRGLLEADRLAEVAVPVRRVELAALELPARDGRVERDLGCARRDPGEGRLEGLGDGLDVGAVGGVVDAHLAGEELGGGELREQGVGGVGVARDDGGARAVDGGDREPPSEPLEPLLDLGGRQLDGHHRAATRQPRQRPRAAAKVVCALEMVPAAQRIAWRIHRVRQGESIVEIAKSYRTFPQRVAEVNRLDGTAPEEGSLLVIPAAPVVQKAASGRSAKRTAASRGRSRTASSTRAVAPRKATVLAAKQTSSRSRAKLAR